MENVKTQFSEIEVKIQEYLIGSRVWNQIGDKEDINSNWTLAINQLLFELGKNIDTNYFIASKSEGHDNPEWLYDMVWYTENECGLDEIKLVMECEWKAPKRWQYGEYSYDQELKSDFEKLMVARCETRLMILESNDKKESDERIEKLRRIVAESNMSREGDRYLFAVWDMEKQQFYFELYVH